MMMIIIQYRHQITFLKFQFHPYYKHDHLLYETVRPGYFVLAAVT
jgi:hypothetical protein